MNDGTVSIELQRTAAVASIRAAKKAFTIAAVSYLKGADAQDQVQSAQRELSEAREPLRILDDAEVSGVFAEIANEASRNSRSVVQARGLAALVRDRLRLPARL